MQNITKDMINVKFREEIIKLNQKVKGGKGLAYINFSDFPNLDLVLRSKTDYKIFLRTNTGCIIGTTAKRKNLYLTVPNQVKGIVIGKGGHRIKRLASDLGVYHIEVTEEK